MNIKNSLEDAVVKSAASSFYGKIARFIFKSYLNLFVADKDEYYDYTEPSDKKMRNKTFWVQIEITNGGE